MFLASPVFPSTANYYSISLVHKNYTLDIGQISNKC